MKIIMKNNWTLDKTNRFKTKCLYLQRQRKRQMIRYPYWVDKNFRKKKQIIYCLINIPGNFQKRKIF